MLCFAGTMGRQIEAWKPTVRQIFAIKEDEWGYESSNTRENTDMASRRGCESSNRRENTDLLYFAS